ncbi:hypothetical protein ABDK56_12870 [Sphingomonas sp. ASV193]|uniref:hypothetical protein n=1 Tax=Sphingomonas sp. ASV193 TaxID=3144405 RepID=UPI0032E9062B
MKKLRLFAAAALLAGGGLASPAAAAGRNSMEWCTISHWVQGLLTHLFVAAPDSTAVCDRA